MISYAVYPLLIWKMPLWWKFLSPIWESKSVKIKLSKGYFDNFFMWLTPVNGERPYAKQNFPIIFITKKIRTQRLNFDRPFLAVIFLFIMIFYTYVQKISCISRYISDIRKKWEYIVRFSLCSYVIWRFCEISKYKV